jgi:hypothetical protein
MAFPCIPSILLALLLSAPLAQAFAALSQDRLEKTTSFYQTVGCRNLVIAWDKRGGSTEGAAAIARELAALSGILQRGRVDRARAGSVSGWDAADGGVDARAAGRDRR